jgi:hypothetical protein
MSPKHKILGLILSKVFDKHALDHLVMDDKQKVGFLICCLSGADTDIKCPKGYDQSACTRLTERP